MEPLFPHRKVLIVNIRHIMWVAIRAYLSTHILACLFVIISAERIRADEAARSREYESVWEVAQACLAYYVEALYFVVMT